MVPVFGSPKGGTIGRDVRHGRGAKADGFCRVSSREQASFFELLGSRIYTIYSCKNVARRTIYDVPCLVESEVPDPSSLASAHRIRVRGMCLLALGAQDVPCVSLTGPGMDSPQGITGSKTTGNITSKGKDFLLMQEIILYHHLHHLQSLPKIGGKNITSKNWSYCFSGALSWIEMN